MPTEYRLARGEQVNDQVLELLNLHHKEILDCKASIDILFATGEYDEETGLYMPPLKLHGVTCAAIARIIPTKDRAAGRADLEITIDAIQYGHMEERQQLALLDHELTHFQTMLDRKSGEVKRDNIGRPRFKMRQHDHEVGWFVSVAERWKEDSQEVKQAKSMMDDCGQAYWPHIFDTA